MGWWRKLGQEKLQDAIAGKEEGNNLHSSGLRDCSRERSSTEVNRRHNTFFSDSGKRMTPNVAKFVSAENRR